MTKRSKVTYWDGKRYRRALGYVGENGIRPAPAKYKADANGNLIEVP